ncbi:MAG: ATP/GTP-binding protein, partial [Gammaproteobacteria bacterium]|nr:ATP/GTP-binding protein [Gammaproteobacteria bacterium]
NIAKIFGELITLIEPSKRLAAADAATVTLPYSKDEEEPFGVPDNLHLIGTMNTADRSIALLDTALRRRFEFVEMMPQPNHPDINSDIDGVNCRKLLAAINKRISVLLDREHQIGHSYLIGVRDMTELARVFQRRIMPLLQEYFYDDWERIYLVLNKNAFVRARKADEDLFAGADTVDADRSFYELLDAKDANWKAPDNYRKIYANTPPQPDDGDD